MNHVATILLVFGAGLACGLWVSAVLVYAGLRELIDNGRRLE